MRSEVIKAVEKEKLIVIVRGIEGKKLVPLTKALYEGGIRLMEITYSADGTVSDEEVAQNIKMLSDEFGDLMHIGAGTVLTEKQVLMTKDAGGRFIISPDVYEPVVTLTRSLGMVSMPGALTPTEIRTAVRAGADYVKLFPITSMGPKYVKAIKAPLSDVKLLAVGGINLDNMQEYIKAGVVGFGISSNVIDKNMVKDDDWTGIKMLAERYVKGVKGL